MQFVMHEVLGVCDELKALPPHADVDAERSMPSSRKGASSPPT